MAEKLASLKKKGEKSKSAYLTFSTLSSPQINLGFRPKMFSISSIVGSGNLLEQLYNEDASTTTFINRYKTTSAATTETITIGSNAQITAITDTGFVIHNDLYSLFQNVYIMAMG